MEFAEEREMFAGWRWSRPPPAEWCHRAEQPDCKLPPESRGAGVTAARAQSAGLYTGHRCCLFRSRMQIFCGWMPLDPSQENENIFTPLSVDVWDEDGLVYPYRKFSSFSLTHINADVRAVWQRIGCWQQTTKRLILLLSVVTPDSYLIQGFPSLPLLPYWTHTFFPQSLQGTARLPINPTCAKPTDFLSYAAVLKWRVKLLLAEQCSNSLEVLLLFVLHPNSLPWAPGHTHLYAAPCPMVPQFQTSLAACCCLHNHSASRWTTHMLKVTLIRRNCWKHVCLLTYPAAFWLYSRLLTSGRVFN